MSETAKTRLIPVNVAFDQNRFVGGANLNISRLPSTPFFQMVPSYKWNDDGTYELIELAIVEREPWPQELEQMPAAAKRPDADGAPE